MRGNFNVSTNDYHDGYFIVVVKMTMVDDMMLSLSLLLFLFNLTYNNN